MMMIRNPMSVRDFVGHMSDDESRARSTACSDFGTLIGLHDQRNL